MAGATLNLILTFVVVLKIAGFCLADDWQMEGKNPLHKAISQDVINPPLTLAWTFSTGDAITASPVVTNGIVYVGSYDGKFYAIDAEKGKKIWDFTSDGDLMFWAPAAVSDNVVVVGGCDGIIYARDAKSGNSLWKVHTDGVISGGATIEGDTVYIGSMDNNMYALDLKTGKKKWQFFANWYFLSAPLIDAANHVLYTNAHDHMGYALDTRDGKLIWRELITLAGGYPNNGPPSIEGDRLFMAVHNFQGGNLRCFETATGKPLWTANTLVSTVGCVVKGTRVFAGTNVGLTAFNTEDGKVIWEFKDNAYVSRCTPAISGNTIYFCSKNGKVYGIDMESGQKTWEFATGCTIDGSPAIANGRLYVTATDGKLYCFIPER